MAGRPPAWPEGASPVSREALMPVAGSLAQVLFLGGLADAALCDLRRFRIPNRDPLLLLAAFAVSATAQPPAGGWAAHLAAGAAVFAAGAVLFRLGVWGGGDVKLLAGVALWCGFAGLGLVLGVMALAGGVLALAALAVGRARGTAAAGEHLPYGLAIAAGAVAWWWEALAPALAS